MANEFIARNGVISKSNIVVSGSLTALSTITAQTLVVQTITSSISSITGSTNFGSLSSNNHTFTGSMYVSGSLLSLQGNRSGIYVVNTASAFIGGVGSVSWQVGAANTNYTDLAIAANQNMYLYTNNSATSAMFVSSSGYIGLGTTTPVSLLHIQSGSLTIAKTAIGSATEVGNITFRNDWMGPYDWAQIKGVNGSNHDFSNIVFSTTYGFNSMSEKARITSDGYLRLATKGIQFNADTSDANSLDDYEEGTFTPSVNLLGTVTYGSRVGYYTKIGNVVYYYIYIVVSSSDTTQDNTSYSISGLPFTAKSGDSGLNPLAPALTENFYKTSTLIGMYFQVSYNNSAGTFLQNSFNNELANKTYYTSARRSYYAGANHYINITGFYYVS
jgi:hypothetical protein